MDINDIKYRLKEFLIRDIVYSLMRYDRFHKLRFKFIGYITFRKILCFLGIHSWEYRLFSPKEIDFDKFDFCGLGCHYCSKVKLWFKDVGG